MYPTIKKRIFPQKITPQLHPPSFLNLTIICSFGCLGYFPITDDRRMFSPPVVGMFQPSSLLLLLLLLLLLFLVVGTLNSALQDNEGRPKRSVSTIVHILNDLLGATPPHPRVGPFGNSRSTSYCRNMDTSRINGEYIWPEDSSPSMRSFVLSSHHSLALRRFLSALHIEGAVQHNAWALESQ